MNQHDEYSALRQAVAAGARIQRWVLNRDGEPTSANGSWSIVDNPQFTCPAHLYRIFPEDAHLVQNDGRDAARYRELKKHFNAKFHRATADYWVMGGEMKTDPRFFDEETPLSLDAALDAAMESAQ